MKNNGYLIHENHHNKAIRKFNKEYIIIIISLFVIIIEAIILFIVHQKSREFQIINKQKQKDKELIATNIRVFNSLFESRIKYIDSIKAEKKLLLSSATSYSDKLVRLKTINNNLLMQLNYKPKNRIDSTIIKESNDYFKFEKWTNCSIGDICYKSSIDGLSSGAFHLKCDKYTPTLTLIEVKNGAVLGGFTRASWNGTELKYDNSAFLFSLKYSKVYPIRKDKPAINAHPDLLPSFGLKDIYIDNEKASSQTVLESYDTFKVGYQNHDSHNKKLILTIKEIEVFVMKCIA